MILLRVQPVSMRHFLLNCKDISNGVIAQHFIQERANSLQCLLKEYGRQQDSDLKMEGSSKLHHIHNMLVGYSTEVKGMWLCVPKKIQILNRLI